jgi:excisionase family DNA binding protein
MTPAEDNLRDRLERIEGKLDQLLETQLVRDYYTTAQAAAYLGLAEFTVREWCRLGRLRAEKRRSGRGAHYQWVISRAELLRYEREGLLPVQRIPS